MARKEYDPTVKAAVLTAILAGQTPSSVAKEYNIPRGTVASWAKREGETLDRVYTEAANPGADGNASEVGELLLSYLAANLRSLKNQVEVMGDKEYLKNQSIENLALAHGIQVDKAVRIIEALNRNAEPQPDSA